MKYLILFIKLICASLLIYLAVKNINFSQTSRILYSITGLKVLGIGSVIVLIQTVIAGYKLIPMLELFNYKIRTMDSIKLWFVGSFFSQILISFVGGDAIRLIVLLGAGIDGKASAQSILLDRILGFIALQILYLIAAFFLLKLSTDSRVDLGLLFLGGVGTAMILGFFILGFIPQRLIAKKYIGKILDFVAVSRYLFMSKVKTLYVFLMSILLHLLSVTAIYSISGLLGANISFFEAFIVGIPVMFVSMLPISVGGWGLRENSMILGLGYLGISSEIALSTSIILGFSLFLGSLPGAIIFWTKKRFITNVAELEIIPEYSVRNMPAS